MQSSRLRLCRSPKHIAWATYSLLVNNPVSKTAYVVLLLLEFLLIVFYSFSLVESVHAQNLRFVGLNRTGESLNMTLGNNYTTRDWETGGIPLQFLSQVNEQLDELTKSNPDFLLIFGICYLLLSLAIVLSVLGMATLIKNQSEINSLSSYKGGITLINTLEQFNLGSEVLMVMLVTFVHMPCLELLLCLILNAYHNYSLNSQGMVVAQYLVGAASLLTFITVEVYLARVFTIQVPTTFIPWAQPSSKINYLHSLIKSLLVVFHVIETTGSLSVLQLSILLFLSLAQGLYRIMFLPIFDSQIDFLVKTRDFLCALVLFIGFVCFAIGDTKNYDAVYFLVSAPLVVYGWTVIEESRKTQILTKIKTKALKDEADSEYALILLMQMINNSQREDLASHTIMGNILSLVFSHIEDCQDPYCRCEEIDKYYDLVRLMKQNNNKEVLPLLKSEYQTYQNIINDQSMAGTVSSITQLVSKKLQSGATVEDDKETGKNSAGIDIEEQKFTSKNVVGKKKNLKMKKMSYSVNVQEKQHKYISELLYLFVFDIQRAYPHSHKIQLLATYYSLYYKKKQMLSVFQLRSFNATKLNWLDRCTFLISEQVMLHNIARDFGCTNQNGGNESAFSNNKTLETKINCETLIRLNNLQERFNDCVETLSKSIVGYWKTFEKASLEVPGTQKSGQRIAQEIKQLYEVFNELDCLRATKDYQMYFQFAIVQLHILNDPIAYDLYIGKMKSILEINDVIQRNFSSFNQSNTDASNFIVVNANGSRFGEIIQCSKTLRMVLGYTEQEIMKQNIESFMPSLIRQKHNMFIKKFNQTGQAYIINTKMTVFVKKSNGYVFPAELFLKFHYSIDYQYTFIALINPYNEMHPFGNEVKYNIDQLIFMIAENDSDGRITEISESAVTILKEAGINISGRTAGGICGLLSVSDLMPDFDFKTFRAGREDRYQKKEIYETLMYLDINVFSDQNNQNAVYDLSQLDANSTLANFFLNNNGLVPARVRIFEERFSGGILDMNIICVAFLNKNEIAATSQMQSMSSPSHHEQTKKIANATITFKALKQVKEVQQVASDQEEGQDQREGSQTNSQSSQGSSSSASMSEFRNFHSFSNQQTPFTLVLIIRLIGVLYLIMISIASLNLGITVAKQKESDNDTDVVRYSYDRMNWISRNQMLLRVQLNIANGYEPDDSSIVKDRFSFYKRLQGLRIQEMRQTQSILERSSFDKSPEFMRYESGQNVDLLYLSPQNQDYMAGQTLNVAYNLYIAKMTEINSYDRKNFVGNTISQSIRANRSDKYRPSFQEINIYFASHNGLRPLMKASIDSCDFYAREAEQHAKKSLSTTLTTAIISIVLIIVIGMIIAPILTKAETRKFEALILFLKVPKHQLAILIQNCEYCLKMSDEKRYLEIQRDYESFLGTKLVDQSIEKLRMEKERIMNLQNQVSVGGDSGTDGGFRFSEYTGSRREGSKRADSSVNIANNNRVRNRRTKIGSAMESEGEEAELQFQYKNESLNDVEKSFASNIGRQLGGLPYIRKKITRNNSRHSFNASGRPFAKLNQLHKSYQNSSRKNHEIEDQKEEEDMDLQVGDNEEFEQKENMRFDRNYLNLRSIKKKQEEEKAEALSKDQEELQSKRNEILQCAKSQRLRMILAQLGILAILSTYFLLAYFLSIRTFQTSAVVIRDLENIFFKGACFEQTINFLREKQVRNESILIKAPGIRPRFGDNSSEQIPATDYYLDFCAYQEKTYLGIRKNTPEYLMEAKEMMEALESDKMCEIVMVGENAHLHEKCETAMDGVLNNGLSNAFSYMYQQILKQHLEFLDTGDSRTRTEAILRKQIADKTIVEMIDLKAEILNPVLQILIDKAEVSVINYGKQLINHYVITFIVFAAFLTLGTLILIFKTIHALKQGIWDTNIILKILPFETLPKGDREEIKNFFKS